MGVGRRARSHGIDGLQGSIVKTFYLARGVLTYVMMTWQAVAIDISVLLACVVLAALHVIPAEAAIATISVMAGSRATLRGPDPGQGPPKLPPSGALVALFGLASIFGFGGKQS